MNCQQELSGKIEDIGLYWQALGGNNIDQISGHCYRYTDCTSKDSALTFTTIIIDIGKFDNYQALGIPGASAALPDIREFLAPGEFQAKAVFITHSHPDHLNGLAHYLKLGYKFPVIYMGRYTKMIFDDLFFKEYEIDKAAYPEIRVINPGDELEIGSFVVEVISSSHTCFDALGFIFKTPNAVVYHTGDFKTDNSTFFRKPTDLKRLGRLAGEIDCVVADFCWVMEDGMAIREADTFKKLVSIMRRNPRRKYFIPVYPTHPEMYIIAFLAALKMRKNVVFYGVRDFYVYLNLIMNYGISFTDLARDRIKIIFHPDFGIDKLDDNYVVIGTYNELHESFAANRQNSMGIITARSYFNPLKGKFNLRNIKFVTVYDEPALQGFGHGFLGDLEQINALLKRPVFIPTHCPRFVIENFRPLASHLNFNLVSETPSNAELFRIRGRECVKISDGVANWLAVNYDPKKGGFLTAVPQKPTSGQGFLKRTISRRRCRNKFKEILHQRKKGVCNVKKARKRIFDSQL